MKSLKDEIDLSGEQETISVTEFRARPGDCLTQVSLGKSFVITRQGTAVAVLVPVRSANIAHEIAPDGSCATLGLKGARRDDCSTHEARGGNNGEKNAG